MQIGYDVRVILGASLNKTELRKILSCLFPVIAVMQTANSRD